MNRKEKIEIELETCDMNELEQIMNPSGKESVLGDDIAFRKEKIERGEFYGMLGPTVRVSFQENPDRFVDVALSITYTGIYVKPKQIIDKLKEMGKIEESAQNIRCSLSLTAPGTHLIEGTPKKGGLLDHDLKSYYRHVTEGQGE